MSVLEREVVIIGYGFEYLVMALNCARSIRESNPELATTLITNVAIDPSSVADRFDRVIVRDEPSDANRLVKTSVLDHTTAVKILYVDADSEVVGDLDPAFRMLDNFDVGLKSHAVPVNKPFELAEGIPGGVFSHFAGGMLLLRDVPATREFLTHWQHRMIESGLGRDQPALARAVYDRPSLRLVVLNGVWLASRHEREALFTSKHEQPRIVHYGFPHEDLEVARRLRGILEWLVPQLPAGVVAGQEIERVVEKYRLLSHPMFVSPLTRRIYLAVLHRWHRLRGRQRVDLFDRRSAVAGRAYTKNAGQLWVD